MKYNPAQLLADYLKTLPEFTGIPVALDMAGHVTGNKRIVLYYAGGYRSVRNKADRFDLDVNYYSKTKTDAIVLGMTVREYLLEQIPGIRLGGGKVVYADVVETTAPYDFSDSVTGESRFLNLFSVYTYM